MSAEGIKADIAMATPREAEETAARIWRGVHGRVHTSVKRRTPFMSDEAATALAEDVAENVSAFLSEVFTL